MNNKYGLIIEERKPEDYVFGASPLPQVILQENGDWSDFLPEKEFQNLYGIEPYACVIFTLFNCLETLIYRKYNIVSNFSDRFLATIVDTSNGGTTPQRACEFLRKVGVVPQELWPFSEDIDTCEEFFEPIPPKLYELAKEFLDTWDFKYEAVPVTPECITSALKCSPLLMSVPAWFERMGRYYRPTGLQDNHATTLFYQKEGEYRRVFDSYDSPHIKDVEWEVTPMIVYRFHIEKKTKKQVKSFWQWLLNFFYAKQS